MKSDVNVKNTGDIDAFIRVKLVTYRTNDAGQHIGGTAALPQFTILAQTGSSTTVTLLYFCPLRREISPRLN